MVVAVMDGRSSVLSVFSPLSPAQYGDSQRAVSSCSQLGFAGLAELNCSHTTAPAAT